MSGEIIITDPWVDGKILTYEVDSARGPGWYEAECEDCGRTTSGYESTVEDWAYEHVNEVHPREKDYNGPTPLPAKEPMTTTESPDTPLHHSVSGQETTSEIELAEGRALYQYWRDVLEGDSRRHLGPHGTDVSWIELGAKRQEAWIELAKRINAWVSGTSSNPVPALAQKDLDKAHRLPTIHDSFLVTSWVEGRQVDEEGTPKKVGSPRSDGETAWAATVNDHYLATTGGVEKDEDGVFVPEKSELAFPKDREVIDAFFGRNDDAALAEHAKKVVEINTETPGPLTPSEAKDVVESLGPDPFKARRGAWVRRLFGKGA